MHGKRYCISAKMQYDRQDKQRQIDIIAGGKQWIKEYCRKGCAKAAAASTPQNDETWRLCAGCGACSSIYHKGCDSAHYNKISGKDAAEPVQVEADAGKTADADKTEPQKEEVKQMKQQPSECLYPVYLMLPVLRI